MLLALKTFSVQLIVLGIELERHIAFFFVGHHQIQVLATSTTDESGLAGIERQNVHANAALLMRAVPVELLVFVRASAMQAGSVAVYQVLTLILLRLTLLRLILLRRSYLG